MCCHMDIALKVGGGGVKACQDGLGLFFSHVARECIGLPYDLGIFFHVCPFDKGGGGLNPFGQCPFIEQTHSKKGLPLIESGVVQF